MEKDKHKPCSVGIYTKKDCHKTSYTSNVGFVIFEELSDDDKELYCWRSGIKIDDFHTICYHHEKLLTTKYETYQTKCSDPMDIHSERPIKRKY